MGRPAAAVHAERIIKAISSGDAASSAVAALWRRSGRLHALDPANSAPSVRLTNAEVAAARERLGPLPALAQSHLDRLIQAVGGVGCSVLLADVHGVVLERRGAPCDDTTFNNWGIWTGAGGSVAELRHFVSDACAYPLCRMSWQSSSYSAVGVGILKGELVTRFFDLKTEIKSPSPRRRCSKRNLTAAPISP